MVFASRSNPLLEIGIGRDMLGEDPDGDGAIEAGVPRLVDLTHPASPEGGLDLVGAECGAGIKGHSAPPSLLPCPEEPGTKHDQGDDDDNENFANHGLWNWHACFEFLEPVVDDGDLSCWKLNVPQPYANTEVRSEA